MSIIKHVLEEELNRLLELVLNYENKLKGLPKGSISKKSRNNKIYLYRAYRESDKVRFLYIGRNDSAEAKIALSDRQGWLKYNTLLKKVKSEIKEIRQALNGYK